MLRVPPAPAPITIAVSGWWSCIIGITSAGSTGREEAVRFSSARRAKSSCVGAKGRQIDAGVAIEALSAVKDSKPSSPR